MKILGMFALIFILGGLGCTPKEEGGKTLSSYEDVGSFYDVENELSDSEKIGREIWYKATGGNQRFHHYTFPQRVVDRVVDWGRFLSADTRGTRFKKFGMITDPACCTPGKDCVEKNGREFLSSYNEMAKYGFDWCPGDEKLLAAVGRPATDYRDPACDLKEKYPEVYRDGIKDDPCLLHFGTSAGALGFRKYPNPRFKSNNWDSWEEYAKKGNDFSVEPPFTVGISCGSCHVAYSPVNPPSDPENPKWENIKGLVGNQFIRISEILASGYNAHELEFQAFGQSRPGAVDTSVVPNDFVFNPGTMNKIINFIRRPGLAPNDENSFDNEAFKHDIWKWRNVPDASSSAEVGQSCSAKSVNNGNKEKAWCQPDKPEKCWKYSCRSERVPQILKGGEDNIGPLEAVQRVYLNIGMCSEQCWLNHLTDLYVLNPKQRNYGQTPFDIGQCRRDCPEFRAVEDHLGEVASFLLAQNSFDLYDAKVLEKAKQSKSEQNEKGSLDRAVETVKKTYREGRFNNFVEERFSGSINRGSELFATRCAECHSSMKAGANFKSASNIDAAISPGNMMSRSFRRDWLGKDRAVSVNEVGTYRCRSLHSNHMKGHVWEQYASETYRQRQEVKVFNKSASEFTLEKADGGRGYYRGVSLINSWAFAPFLHNNAIGPEVCGDPQMTGRDNFYFSPYEDESGRPIEKACVKYPVSIEERLDVYEQSMESLLSSHRIVKKSKTTKEVALPLGPKVWMEELEKLASRMPEDKMGRFPLGLSLKIPKGTSLSLISSFNHKLFAGHLVEAMIYAWHVGKEWGYNDKEAAYNWWAPSEEKVRNTRRTKLIAFYKQKLGPNVGQQMGEAIYATIEKLLGSNERVIEADMNRMRLYLSVYAYCTDEQDNKGHTFGEGLSKQDVKDLTAFLATM